MRVLILTASIGAGHDLPAEVLAAELQERSSDTQVVTADSLEAAGPLVRRLVLGGSAFESSLGNFVYDVEYWLITRAAPIRRLTSWLGERLARRGLEALIVREQPDVLVSTYPGATEILGRLRDRGRLGVPLVSAITDLAALHYWAHPGVDLHLITHRESADEVRAIAGHDANIVTVRGLNAFAYTQPLGRAEARSILRLPADAPIVAVSGGGWGVGDLAGAVDEVLSINGAHAVVLCGTNSALRSRLEERFAHHGDRVDIWGFTDQIPELLAAADALVHSTAGLTVLEAIVRGCPAISYGWGRGHIRANNRAYARLGLAQVAGDRPALAGALRDALSSRPAPDTSFAELPSAASVVLERFGNAGVEHHATDAR